MIPARIVRLAGAFLAAIAVGAVMAGAASAEVVYNNVPAKLPGNFASIGLAATSTTEFGGRIELANTARKQPTVTVVMSSWACQSGGWTTGDCSTPKPKKGFKVPLTVRVYNAGELSEGPVAEATKNITMLYRPSADTTNCTGGRWYQAAEAHCYNGFAFPVSVKLSKLKKMPKNAVVSFLYPHSTGPAQSLNVAVSEPPENTLSVGAQPVEEWFANSTSSEMYCPGAKDLGTFGPEEGAGCQQEEGVPINYQPVFSVNAN
jgi:hypothetical protein